MKLTNKPLIWTLWDLTVLVAVVWAFYHANSQVIQRTDEPPVINVPKLVQSLKTVGGFNE